MDRKKSNVLFYTVYPLHDDDRLLRTLAEPERAQHGEPPLFKLLRQEECEFDKVVLLHRPGWRELAQELGRAAQARHDLEIDILEMPSIEQLAEEDLIEFLYNFALDYRFDYQKKNYFIYTGGMDFVSKIFLYYLSTRNMLHITMVSLPYVQDSEKALFSSANFTYYAALTEKILARKGDVVSQLKGGIETRDPEFNRYIDETSRVVLSTWDPIFIFGPVGSGKSSMARRIFELRKDRGLCPGKFVEVNCSFLRGEAGRAMLFGQQAGVSTGLASSEGLLRQADNGIIHMKDIGLLDLDEQAMLLQAIEYKRFYPVGSDQEASSNFMLICSSSQNLMTEVQTGHFRSDLLSKITMWSFYTPPLRERRIDIPPFLDYSLAMQSAATGIECTMTDKARERFLQFAMSPEIQWEGNLRQFSATLRRMCTLAENGQIDLAGVEAQITYLKTYRNEWNKASDNPAYSFSLVRALLGEDAVDNMDFFDCSQLENVLGVCIQCRNLADAGRRLFGHSRLRKEAANDSDRIRKYLSRYGLSWSDISTMRKA